MGLFGNAKKFLQNEKERKIIDFFDVEEKSDCFLIGNKFIQIKDIKKRELIADVIEKVEEDKLFYAKEALVDGLLNVTRIDDFEPVMIKNQYLNLSYKLITNTGDVYICKMDRFRINNEKSMKKVYDVLTKLIKTDLLFNEKMKSSKEEKQINNRLNILLKKYDVEALKKEQELKNTKTTSY